MGVDTEQALEIIREGIRHRYATYHALDRDRFPDFEYNTNRANYKPLRISFEHEFYTVRKLDQSSTTIHIPSTNTLALLFTDDSYTPNAKILNTCRAYAISPLNPTIESDPKARFLLRTLNRRAWWLGLTLAGISLIAYVVLTQLTGNRAANDLEIHSPRSGQVVPRSVAVTGRVENEEAVWLVVHPMMKGEKFYVQDVVPVLPDGTWTGNVLVGIGRGYSVNTAFEIRAFVNPKGAYNDFDEKGITAFDSWPEQYELATKPVILIRKGTKK